jgi:glycerophosphoryl diester phosphodiesterase
MKKLRWMIPLSLLLFLVLTALVPYLRFKSIGTTPLTRPTAPEVIAHRGASGSAPENTMAAFKKALALGVKVIETDVHLSKDGAIVVMHDPTVDRTTDGNGEVVNLSAAELKALDAGIWFGEGFKGEQVPTIEEVFDLVEGKAMLLVELKWRQDGEAYEGLVRKMIDLIAQRGARSWVVLQTFHPDYLRELDTDASKVVFDQLVFGVSDLVPCYYDNTFRLGRFTPFANARGVNIHYLYGSRDFIAEQHKAGRRVSLWTLNDESDLARGWNSGADGLITNHPERAPAE